MRLAAGINVGPDNVAAGIDAEGPCGDGFWEIDGSKMAISQQETMELAGAVPINPEHFQLAFPARIVSATVNPTVRTLD
jgi:hypothetical protein